MKSLDIEEKRQPALTLQTERHRMLHQVPDLGLTLDVHSMNELCFISMVTTESSMFLVHEGTMKVESENVSLIAKQGEFLLLQAGVPLKITHQPSENGIHKSTGLLWDRKIIAKAAPSLDACFPAPALLFGARDKHFHDSFLSAYRSLKEAEHLPASIVAHRMNEVLQWLSLKSIFFRPAENLSLTSRLRDLLVTDPADNWLEKKVANALHMSQSTLRRRLAAESTSFRDILSEVRMLHALRLLHSTNQSIGNIARNSGYTCQSRFSERFRKRFGFYPSIIRGHKRINHHTDNKSSATKSTF